MTSFIEPFLFVALIHNSWINVINSRMSSQNIIHCDVISHSPSCGLVTWSFVCWVWPIRQMAVNHSAIHATAILYSPDLLFFPQFTWEQNYRTIYPPLANTWTTLYTLLLFFQLTTCVIVPGIAVAISSFPCFLFLIPTFRQNTLQACQRWALFQMLLLIGLLPSTVYWQNCFCVHSDSFIRHYKRWREPECSLMLLWPSNDIYVTVES